ncbi:MAG: hypothetical protein ACFFFT_00670 [Candidatus Thorarchaeota archaeon]
MTVLTTEKSGAIEHKIVIPMYNKRSSWKTIAKNEIKLRTSHFRNHRKLFFISLYSLLFIWAFIVAPILFDLFMPTLATEYSSVFKPAVALIIESMMMVLFLSLVMYPLNNVYREDETSAKESLLATPVKAKDIFLGEFLGKSPIYTIAVLIFGPIVTGMINPILDLAFYQFLTIYGSVFILVYFANLVGSIIASWIEHKISKNERARDLGKTIIWVFTIMMVVIMYAVMFFLNFLLTHPGLKNWLAFYPSLWYSNLILYSIDPLLLDPYILNIWMSIGLSLSFPLIILYFSYKRAESFYTLEGGLEKSSKTIGKRENAFFGILRFFLGHWGGLTVIQLKRFLRKKANIARIAYVVGLLGFISWFLTRMGDDILGKMLATTIIIAIGGGMNSILLGHLGFVDSKDIIWVYKRSPRGIRSLVYSYLLTMVILNIFLAIFITTLLSIFLNLDIVMATIFFFEFLIFGELSMCQASGIQCLNPAFGEKDANMKGNAMISMVLLQPLLFMPTFLGIFIDIGSIKLTLLLMQGIIFLYIIITSLPLLYFGLNKLRKIE